MTLKCIGCGETHDVEDPEPTAGRGIFRIICPNAPLPDRRRIAVVPPPVKDSPISTYPMTLDEIRRGG